MLEQNEMNMSNNYDEIIALRSRLAEAEALLREAKLQLRYRELAAGLRGMIDAFLKETAP